jgi:hypothetical protein
VRKVLDGENKGKSDAKFMQIDRLINVYVNLYNFALGKALDYIVY